MKDLADITRVSAAQPMFTLQVNPTKQPAIIYEVVLDLLSSQSMSSCLHSKNLQCDNSKTSKITGKSKGIMNYFLRIGHSLQKRGKSVKFSASVCDSKYHQIV
jgi:hypothetical protein